LRAASVRICSLCARYGATAGLLLTEDRTGDAELQGFDNHYWAPEVIKLSLHFTLTFEAPVPFSGAGGIGTSPAFTVHVGQEHRLPCNEEASNPRFDRLTSESAFLRVPTKLFRNVVTPEVTESNPHWSDRCENGSDVITAKLQAQHLQVGAVHGADETKGKREREF